MRPLVKMMLDKRRPNKENKFPLKLRITFNRIQKLYKLNVFLTDAEYVDVMKEKPRKEYRDLKDALDVIERRAWKIIDSNAVFTFEAFNVEWKGANKKTLDVYSLYDKYIEDLKKERRLKTAISYETSKNSFQYFKKNLLFSEVTKSFLSEYEMYMISNGKSVTTVGIYVRCLRAVYNYAIDTGIIKRDENYPFGKRKYQIPASNNIKKALSEDEFKAVRDYSLLENETWKYYKDLWLFSFYCQGMNMKDIALLKYSNIDGDFIRFKREKTKRSTKTASQLITVYQIPEIKSIIEKWASPKTEEDSFLFPIFSPEMNDIKMIEQLGQLIQNINACMQRIALAISLKKPLTTYVARHTFATLSRNMGVPTEYISEALGHTTTTTTKRYLSSFDDHSKRTYSDILRFK